MTLSDFGYLTQNYNDIIFSFPPLFWFPLKNKIKHFEVRQKYSATRRIFNSLLRACKRCQTRPVVFDLLHLCVQQRPLILKLYFVQ